jgi:hypothetical protein
MESSGPQLEKRQARGLAATKAAPGAITAAKSHTVRVFRIQTVFSVGGSEPYELYRS